MKEWPFQDEMKSHFRKCWVDFEQRTTVVDTCIWAIALERFDYAVL